MMTEALIYHFWILLKPFLLQTDALGLGLGAVLIQNGQPVVFFSKNFFPKSQNSSTYVRALHAIKAGCKNGDTTF